MWFNLSKVITLDWKGLKGRKYYPSVHNSKKKWNITDSIFCCIIAIIAHAQQNTITHTCRVGTTTPIPYLTNALVSLIYNMGTTTTNDFPAFKKSHWYSCWVFPSSNCCGSNSSMEQHVNQVFRYQSLFCSKTSKICIF